MARKTERSFGERVWRGDPTVVAEARRRYEANREGELVRWASILYSFRRFRRYAEELIELQLLLLARARIFIHLPPREGDAKKLADEADCIATYLEWISRQEGLSEAERDNSLEVAERVCVHGIHFAEELHNKDHSLCLLMLTYARIFLARQDYDAMREELDRVALWAKHIEDRRQRARVYRKLGFLQRKAFQPIHGFGWGIRALFVLGVPLDVRMKSAVALFGIDR